MLFVEFGGWPLLLTGAKLNSNDGCDMTGTLSLNFINDFKSSAAFVYDVGVDGLESESLLSDELDAVLGLLKSITSAFILMRFDLVSVGVLLPLAAFASFDGLKPIFDMIASLLLWLSIDVNSDVFDCTFDTVVKSL